MGRVLSTTLGLAIAITGITAIMLIGRPLSAAQDKKPGADNGFVTIAELNLSQPNVSINGPFPTLVRKAKVGQMIQVQISYPISPPFPKTAKIETAVRIFSPVGVYQTPGEIVALTQKPQQGKIGVGYLSVFVKAMNKGQGMFTAKIKLSDGSVKDVPFVFDIDDATGPE